jgi:hypothetical protein
MKQSNFIIELQYQYLNYITGIPVLYKILKKIHNTGKKIYTSDRQVQEIREFFLDIHSTVPSSQKIIWPKADRGELSVSNLNNLMTTSIWTS